MQYLNSNSNRPISTRHWLLPLSSSIVSIHSPQLTVQSSTLALHSLSFAGSTLRNTFPTFHVTLSKTSSSMASDNHPPLGTTSSIYTSSQEKATILSSQPPSSSSIISQSILSLVSISSYRIMQKLTSEMAFFLFLATPVLSSSLANLVHRFLHTFHLFHPLYPIHSFLPFMSRKLSPFYLHIKLALRQPSMSFHTPPNISSPLLAPASISMLPAV